MKDWLGMVLRVWRGLRKPPQGKVDRSRLVGMYLSRANQPPVSGARGSGTQQRQDGKFSQNRRRG